MTKKSSKSKAKPEPVQTQAPKPQAATAAQDGGSGKIAKTQLVDLVADKTGLTRKQSEEAVSAMLECVTDAIKQGKSVGLPGLGTLSVRETAARTGVRPGTSERIQIPAGKKVNFKAATTLKASL